MCHRICFSSISASMMVPNSCKEIMTREKMILSLTFVSDRVAKPSTEFGEMRFLLPLFFMFFFLLFLVFWFGRKSMDRERYFVHQRIYDERLRRNDEVSKLWSSFFGQSIDYPKSLGQFRTQTALARPFWSPRGCSFHSTRSMQGTV